MGGTQGHSVDREEEGTESAISQRTVRETKAGRNTKAPIPKNSPGKLFQDGRRCICIKCH